MYAMPIAVPGRARISGALRLATDWPWAISANVPPSPLLSALSRISTYLSVTTSSSVQVMSDRMPSTASWPVAPCSVAAFTASFKA